VSPFALFLLLDCFFLSYPRRPHKLFFAKKKLYKSKKKEMADVELRFKKAVYLIRNGPPSPNTSNDEKLAFYGLYKQATVGDNNESQPWAVQLEARAKWEAWNSHKGMSQTDAKKAYVKILDDRDPNWENHEVLKGFSG